MNEPTRILIVDDSVENRSTYKRLLMDGADADFVCFEAENTKAALDSLRRDPPDCILVDHDLADLERITENWCTEKKKNPALVVLTREETEPQALRTRQHVELECLAKSEANAVALRRCIAVAIEKAGLKRLLKLREGALQRLAAIDELTGLYSRSYAMNHLDEEIYRAQRFGTPFCVALVGLDEFKEINQKHGDIVGNLILRTIGHLISRGTRFVDLVSRYENEKFLLILSNTGLEKARLLCNRIRGKIKALDFLGSDRSTFHVTGSAGLTEYDRNAPTQELLIARAAGALHEAQLERGNLVHCWQGDSTCVDRNRL